MNLEASKSYEVNSVMSLQKYVYCICIGLSHFSRVQLFVAPWIVAHQAPLSMGLSRQECWSGLPFPSLLCMYRHIYYLY